MSIIGHILGKCQLQNWREWRAWAKKVKRHYRASAEIHRKGGQRYRERLQSQVRGYLEVCRKISRKVQNSKEEVGRTLVQSPDIQLAMWLKELIYFHGMLDKHIDLVERRILKGEKIDHAEKVFSIFETHTEWIQKGKKHKPVELGHSTLIATDQFGFIVDHQVVIGEKDPALAIPLGRRLADSYGESYQLKSLSFDRGFFSFNAKRELGKLFERVIMPKRGKKTLAQQAEENTDSFRQGKKAHAAVESNINQLEHNGVNRCPDKGLDHFKRYVAFGVVAYNLQKLGQLVLEKTEAGSVRSSKRAA
jgi:hypothetical protein